MLLQCYFILLRMGTLTIHANMSNRYNHTNPKQTARSHDISCNLCQRNVMFAAAGTTGLSVSMYGAFMISFIPLRFQHALQRKSKLINSLVFIFLCSKQYLFHGEDSLGLLHEICFAWVSKPSLSHLSMILKSELVIYTQDISRGKVVGLMQTRHLSLKVIF